MSTLTNLCMITFCLLIIAQASARSGGVIADTYIPNNKATSTDENFENCSGLGEEECLMRRTLAAHIDYIYTQNKHN
ncbi:hypothetical protein DCAR_0934567 [Daucus carota subsp. sativus]|uniref:Phytosulfokine n=1 Tax=Daucus carota subsp. sativus TaxID=79200 RepID=A0AAF1BCV3_DAUCS|nr:hypothetical protein DCAR_0934567 [Daucus carota subsp. sativus]